MRAFYLLARLRVLEVTRSRSTAFFFVALPLLLLAALGAVFANGHPFERRRVVLAGAAARAPASTATLRAALARYPELAVETAPSPDAARARLRSHMADAIVLADAPAGDTSRAAWRIQVGPRGVLFARGLATALPAAPDGANPAIETVPVPRWGYVHHLVPGLLAFTVLIAGLFGMGYPMLRYRQNQFLKKLALTPLRRSTFVGAQLCARALLVLVQLAVLVASAAVLFDLPVTLARLAWLAVITTLGLLTFMGVGFALACLLKTDALMVDAISALTTPLVLLSETFFPTSELPAPLPLVAAALPTTQLVRLGRAVLLDGTTDLAALGPGFAILTGWLAVTFAVSVLFFRWHD